MKTKTGAGDEGKTGREICIYRIRRPKDVADFLGFDDDEDIALIKRDAYE